MENDEVSMANGVISKSSILHDKSSILVCSQRFYYDSIFLIFIVVDYFLCFLFTNVCSNSQKKSKLTSIIMTPVKCPLLCL